MAKDPEFIALNEDLKVRDARQDRKFESLNFAKRKAENDADDARHLKNINERFKREGKKALKNINDLTKDYGVRELCLKEAERIAADFAKMQQAEKASVAEKK